MGLPAVARFQWGQVVRPVPHLGPAYSVEPAIGVALRVELSPQGWAMLPVPLVLMVAQEPTQASAVLGQASAVPVALVALVALPRHPGLSATDPGWPWPRHRPTLLCRRE